MHSTESQYRENQPVAIVTGGGSGIGAAIASMLTRQGWSVVICGRRSSTLKRIAETTGAHAVVADITNPDGVSHLVDYALEQFGKLDGLVLNAGVIRPGLVGELSDQDWAAMIETNLTAPFKLLRAALPHLVESKGSVIGIASVSALQASGGIAGYNASKAGLSMLLRSVAIDYGPQGVRANVVCPGWTRSEMADMEMSELGAERGLDKEQAYKLASCLAPLERPALAEEVASVASWLLSPAASYMNAAVIPVDGGLSSVDPGTIAFDRRFSLSP
ncbi:SDR family NAD(P)-dependent oxidoreductase [Marinobacter sp. GN3S48]|uniref:SDR family NAD(P)-dependent oxidoreductase n=1 Tax=Marinobacter sp. GN3S48 TaxID=3382302 RepID=UPI00387AF2EC